MALRKKLSRLIPSLIVVASVSACNQNTQDSKNFPTVTFLPQIEGAELYFRGFVTDAADELVSDLKEFSRVVTHQDTLDGKPVYVYISESQKTPFYTDAQGTVWEYTKEEVGFRIVPYGYAFRDPIAVQHWKPVLKVHEGVGTEWTVKIDTTFEVVAVENGAPHRIRYVHVSKGRFEGWSEAIVPQSPKKKYKVLETHWPEENTVITDETTGEELFSSHGWARQFFEPTLGCIKYITDFSKYDQLDPEEKTFKATWELTRAMIPN